MEIYNEETNDLLAVENQRLQIHEHLERGVFVAGLTEEIVSDAEQILKLIHSGEVNRHFGETNMTVHSSETIAEYGSSRKIHEHEQRKSDEKSEKIAEEETMDDKEAKEGNRAWAVLREVQTKIGKEVACNHVQKVGFSTDGFATTLTMRKLHLIWVTARMHIEVYEYPAWSDVVEIETWCQSEGRIGTRRDWIFKDCSTGEVIGRATSKWVMMNQDTRRHQRVTDDDVHVNLRMLGSTLARHRSKPRVYIGCMKSGPVLAQKGVKYHEPEYWKFGEEGNNYFRHATGQI